MIDAPPRGSCIVGHVTTPSKELIIQVSADEENQPVNQVDDRHCSKRCSPEKTSIHKDTMPLADSRPDKRSRALDQPEIGSDCDTDTSSTVCARREWLKEFTKQHENTFPRKTSAQPVPTRSSIKSTVPPPAPMSSQKPSKQSTTESVASALVNRMMSEPPKRSFALPGYKPKMRPDEVQATNEGYASVAKLSEWLANDPTSTKKKKHVRRGKNIITKSRTFEKDMENVIVIETNMPRGAVKDRTKMIQGAFKDEAKIKKISGLGSLGHKNAIPRYAMSEIGTGDFSTRISVAQKKDWLKKAFKTAIEDETPKVEAEAARSEIIFNDAASCLSVSDKKDWLKNAFKKGSSESPATKLGYNKAMTDVMHDRGGEDAASRVKRRFLERSRRTPTKAPSQSEHAPERECSMTSPVVKSESKQDEHVCQTTNEERTGPSPTGSNVEPECNYPIEKDQTPVDFKAARHALIQRGKQNGHPMQVVNKVYMKKTKFEKMEMEQRRRSGTQGLLKPSWEEADPTTGLPSNVYDKKLVPNIAPRKSFEELP